MKLIQINKRRSGFTLVELLLAISIMAVLATMTLALMRSATEDAKESATLARISKIEAMLQLELENYEVRRLPISLANLELLAGTADRNVIRDLKRQIIADLISAEMPRPDLVGVDPVLSVGMGQFPSITIPLGASESFDEWLSNNYPGLHSELTQNRYDSAGVLYWRNKFNPMPGVAGTGNEDFNNFGEYLYEILSRLNVDGTSGVEVLGNVSIGDSDEDGIPEVVDAWGNPLQMRILQVRSNRQRR